MVRSKPRKMEMTAQINSNLNYVIQTNILTRQDKNPTSSRRSMNSTVEHLTQRNILATSAQQPSNGRIW
jgi:hypothetical protein